MKRVSLSARILASFLLLPVCGDAGRAGAQALPAPETTAPKGDYQSALLKLDKAWDDGADLPLFLSFRDGKGAAVWYAAGQRKDAHRLWIDSNSLRLAGGKLSGEVQGRMVKLWAPIAEVGNYSIELTATVEGDKVSGGYTGKFGPTAVSGNLSGALAGEAQFRKQNAFPAGKDWPAYYGINDAFRGPDTGTPLIDDLQQARPLWKAEEALPCMWGKGPDDRYAHRACMVGWTGGASSPVVADGRVFVYYYRPSGPIGVGSVHSAAAPKLATELEIRAFAAKHSQSPIAQQALVEWYRPFADDIVVCLDAATGKILWKTELKDRSGNFQTHKWRGYNPTPTVADGVVYVQGYGNRLYALNAATGKLRWEFGDVATKTIGKGGPPGATGPVVLREAVLFSAGSTTIALTKDGKQFWRKPGGNLLVWRKNGQERLIAYGGQQRVSVACLDPRTGDPLWQGDTAYTTSAGTVVHPILDGDLLVGFDVKVTANVSENASVIAYRLKEDGLEKAWAAPAPVPMTDTYGLTIANGHVYVDGDKETFCLSLADGKKLASVANVGGARTQVAFFADNRLFIQPEGRHGGQSFFMLTGDPKDFRLLSAETPAGGKHALPGQWHPPHPHDTAYANQPVIYPVVDGRLFIRGHDGLYCYDLRKPTK